MTTDTNNMTTERLAELIAEAREIARTEPQHEWDRRALEWPLTPESVVVEVGGYKGRWAYQIAERYNPRLYVFEPQRWAYKVCRGVLAGYNAQVFDYGIDPIATVVPMFGWGTDGCSILDTGNQSQDFALFRSPRIFSELGIDHIDLMMMNIEGCEYGLLYYMLEESMAPKHGIIWPDRLMVQFHEFADPDGSRLKSIRRRMAKHYTIAWDYGITLIAWQKKGL